MCNWITSEFSICTCICSGSNNKWRYVAIWEQLVRKLRGRPNKRKKAGQKVHAEPLFTPDGGSWHTVHVPHILPYAMAKWVCITWTDIFGNQWRHLSLLGFPLATYLFLSFQCRNMLNIYKRTEVSKMNSHVPNVHLKNLLTFKQNCFIYTTPLYYLEANPRYSAISSINISACISLNYQDSLKCNTII